MKIAFGIIVLYFAVALISHATPQEAFLAYKSAILEQEGEKAASIVTTTTLEEYQKYVDAAKYGQKESLQKLSFLTRLQTLIIRHRVPKNILKEMDGKTAFIYAVDNDWIGKTGVVPMEISNVRESGTRAVSEALLNGQKLPYEFTYKNENGQWKFDLTQILMNTEAPMRMAATKAKMEENDFIFMILETVSGIRPTEDLWSAPFKK